MPTVTLNAISSAFPDISNRIRASVYKQSDPLAIVAYQIDTTAGHPIRTWAFSGLPRENYKWLLDEIDADDNVVTNLAAFDVVPSEIDGLLTRNDEQIRVDTTPGFVAGATSATFDGSAGKPDYRGWEIVPSELTGRGIMVRGLDYSWDSVTGLFSLLIPSDIFQTGAYFNIHFEPIIQTIGNAYPSLRDLIIRRITVSTTLTGDDFGKELIVEPDSVYLEVTLPDPATVVEGRQLMIEVNADTNCCVKVVTATSIKWLRGNIYICPNERITIYKYIRSSVAEFRVCDASGNFINVGQTVSDDAIQSGVFNKVLLNGASILKTQYARLYNEYVLTLPGVQVVNYDDWATGNNKYFYSLANSANPTFVNQFHIPDRRGLFERNNNTGKSGDYFDDTIKSHRHALLLTLGDDGNGNFIDNSSNGSNQGMYSANTEVFGSTETMPKHYLINKYALI